MRLDAGHLYKNLLHFLDFALGQTGAHEHIPEKPESPQLLLGQLEISNTIEGLTRGEGGLLAPVLGHRVCLYRKRLDGIEECERDNLYGLGKVEGRKLVAGRDGHHL